MPYESELDKRVFEKDWDTGSGRIMVSVHSYNNGPNKLQITREVKRSDGTLLYARLGRLSKEEAEGILPLIQEAVKNM